MENRDQEAGELAYDSSLGKSTRIAEIAARRWKV